MSGIHLASRDRGAAVSAAGADARLHSDPPREIFNMAHADRATTMRWIPGDELLGGDLTNAKGL